MCKAHGECIVHALERIRCGAACTEAALHAQVAQILHESGMDAQHEVRLAPGCRIDFMCGGIGIEIKKSRPDRARLLAQLNRYAACEAVSALIVVAPKSVRLPKEIGGKPVTMIALERLWGISLP